MGPHRGCCRWGPHPYLQPRLLHHVQPRNSRLCWSPGQHIRTQRQATNGGGRKRVAAFSCTMGVMRMELCRGNVSRRLHDIFGGGTKPLANSFLNRQVPCARLARLLMYQLRLRRDSRLNNSPNRHRRTSQSLLPAMQPAFGNEWTCGRSFTRPPQPQVHLPPEPANDKAKNKHGADVNLYFQLHP